MTLLGFFRKLGVRDGKGVQECLTLFPQSNHMGVEQLLLSLLHLPVCKRLPA